MGVCPCPAFPIPTFTLPRVSLTQGFLLGGKLSRSD